MGWDPLSSEIGIYKTVKARPDSGPGFQAKVKAKHILALACSQVKAKQILALAKKSRQNRFWTWLSDKTEHVFKMFPPRSEAVIPRRCLSR